MDKAFRRHTAWILERGGARRDAGCQSPRHGRGFHRIRDDDAHEHRMEGEDLIEHLAEEHAMMRERVKKT